MERIFTNILCDNVQETAQFYQILLGMERHFDSDWFIILAAPAIPNSEYGLLQKNHEIVPVTEQKNPAGVLITFVVPDCDHVYKKAKDLGAKIVEKPVDMPYGQRRMLIRDPEGTCLDVSSVIDNHN